MTFQDQADVLDEVGTPSSLNPSRSDNDNLLAIANTDEVPFSGNEPVL